MVFGCYVYDIVVNFVFLGFVCFYLFASLVSLGLVVVCCAISLIVSCVRYSQWVLLV